MKLGYPLSRNRASIGAAEAVVFYGGITASQFVRYQVLQFRGDCRRFTRIRAGYQDLTGVEHRYAAVCVVIGPVFGRHHVVVIVIEQKVQSACFMLIVRHAEIAGMYLVIEILRVAVAFGDYDVFVALQLKRRFPCGDGEERYPPGGGDALFAAYYFGDKIIKVVIRMNERFAAVVPFSRRCDGILANNEGTPAFTTSVKSSPFQRNSAPSRSIPQQRIR